MNVFLFYGNDICFNMADDSTENEYHVAEIVKIQAVFRGVLVRKWMKQTREEYDTIFSETERNGQAFPIWKSDNPCRPTIQRKDKRKKSPREVPSPVIDKVEDSSQTTKIKDDMLKKDTLPQTEQPNSVDTKSIKSGRNDEAEVKTLKFLSFGDKFLTVETQTSFCDPSTSTQEKLINEQCVQTENVTTKQFTTTEPVLTTLKKSVQTKVLTIEESTDPITKSDVYDNETTDTAVQECLSVKQGTKLASKGTSFNGNTSETSKKLLSPRENPASTPLGSLGCFSNETSVWDSFHNVTAATVRDPPRESEYPKDYESLQDMRKNIAMELLWVQQAINSRKNYLKLRGQMTT